MKKTLLVILAAVALVAVSSVAVWKSSDNGPRRQGALEGGDAVALSWRGDWSDSAEYARGNVVAVEGVSYVAEGEKLAKPEVGCSECGWTELASSEAQAAAPAAPTLTSPNGSFKIEVTDTGILLSGPNKVSALLSADSLTVDLPKELKVQAGLSVNVKSGGTLQLESSSNGVVMSPVLTLGCAGTGSRPVARRNDTVTGTTNLSTGSLTGTIVSGSSKVFAC
jgi:opacity protein-like surface antigen